MKQFLLCVFLLVSLAVRAEEPVKNEWFTAGETLKFQVYFSFLKAGVAELVYTPPAADQSPYKLQAFVRTTGFLKGLAEVKDDITAIGHHAEPDKFFNTELFSLRLHENDYNTHKEVSFQQTTEKTKTAFRNLKDGTEPEILETEAGARDMLSALYQLRHTLHSPKVGQTYRQTVVNLDDAYQLDLTIQEQVLEDTIFGKNTSLLLVQPTLIPLGDADESRVKWKFWVTNDEHLIPVKIEADTRFGSFMAVLKEGQVARAFRPINKKKWANMVD